MEPIRVLIVDDHPMIRRGLRSVLSSFPDIALVGEAEDGQAALNAIAASRPHVILVDVQLPGENGITLTSQILKQEPGAKVIILTAFSDDEYVLGALEAGAHGYLLKSIFGESVVEAIRQAHEGRRMLSPALMDRVLERFQGMVQTQAKDRFGLTEEECQVLRLIAQGATNDEIGLDLHCTERTVRRRIDEIMVKMGAKTRSQAVAEAVRNRLI